MQIERARASIPETDSIVLATSAALLVLATAGHAAAQDSVVHVVVSGEPSSTDALETAIRDLVAHQAVRIEWTRSDEIDPRDVLSARSGEGGVVARIWADLSDPDRAKLYIANAGSDRFLVRFIALADGYDEVAQESLGQIVASAIDVLLSGGEIGVSREVAVETVHRETGVALERRPIERGRIEPPPREEPGEEPEDDEQPPLHLSIGLGYRASLIAGDPLITSGPLLSFSLGVPSAWSFRPMVEASVQYVLPYDWSNLAVGADFHGASLRIAAGFEAALGDRWLLRAAIGLGADLADVDPHAQMPWEELAPFFYAAPMATLGASVEVTLLAPLAIFAAISVESEISGNHFTVVDPDGGASAVVLQPWRLRPTISLGLALSFGDPRF
jgi:hypothetical protein